MRTVVTGGAGFVGSHLVERLLDRGDDVVCIERPGAGRGWLTGRDLPFHTCGLMDEAALRKHICGADVVFHLAALTEARTPDECYEVNTEGTANLVRAAAACGSAAPRLVFMSSLAAVGPDRIGLGRGLDKDTPPRPLSHYGRSKLQAEAVIHAYADRVPAVVCRFPAIYGPRDRVVLKLFRMVARGFALTIGPWEREVSVLHAADAVSGLLGAAESPLAVGGTYCLAHPRAITWAEFVQAIGRALDCQPRKFAVPVQAANPIALVAECAARLRNLPAVLNRDRVRELSQQRWVCDSRPAMNDLAFRPRFDLEAGILDTAYWLRRVQWI